MSEPTERAPSVSVMRKLAFVLMSAFVGYLLTTGAVAFAATVCRKILATVYPDDPTTIDRIMLESGYTFRGLIFFVLIPYIPLVVLLYRQWFRKEC